MVQQTIVIKKADYGLDAPKLVRNFLIFGGTVVLSGWFLIFYGGTQSSSFNMSLRSSELTRQECTSFVYLSVSLHCYNWAFRRRHSLASNE